MEMFTYYYCEQKNNLIKLLIFIMLKKMGIELDELLDLCLIWFLFQGQHVFLQD